MDKLIRGRVKVEWTRLGEGIWGDYNPNDAADIELLRFDTYWFNYNGEWEPVEDGSYCTKMPVETTPEQREQGLRIIMDKIYRPMTDGFPIKKYCEELSHIGLDWLGDDRS